MSNRTHSTYWSPPRALLLAAGLFLCGSAPCLLLAQQDPAPSGQPGQPGQTGQPATAAAPTALAPTDAPAALDAEGELSAEMPSLDETQEPAQSARELSEEERRIKDLVRHAQRDIDVKRWRESIELVKELVLLRPFDSEYQLTLGLLFRKSGNAEEARRKYQDYMDLGGSRAVGHLLIADALAAEKSRIDKEAIFSNLRKAAENGMNLMKGLDSFESLKPFVTDTEFIKLALQLEQYRIDFDSGISDPMTGRFRRADIDPTALEGKRGTGILAISEQEKLLQEAQSQIQRIELILNVNVVDEAKALAAYKRLVEVCEQGARITDPRLRSVMRKILVDRERIESRIQEIRLKFLYSRAQILVEDMAYCFRNEDYPKVFTLYGEVKNIAAEMLRVNEAFREVSEKVLEVAGEWARKAEIRREFGGRTLRIQGIVSDEQESYAIINDRVLGVGESFDDLRVIKIEPNRVILRFKGENVPLLFKRY